MAQERLDRRLQDACRWDGLAYRSLPGLLTLLVAGLAGLHYWWAVSSGFELPADAVELLPRAASPPPERVVEAIEIRFAWASAHLVLTCAMVVTIFIAVVSSTHTLGSRLTLRLGVLGFLVGIVVFVLRIRQEVLFIPFAGELFNELESAGVEWFSGGIRGWTRVAAVTEGLLFPLLVLVGLAFAGLLTPPPREGRSGHGFTFTELRRRREMATRLLASSAVVLASFVVEFHAILRWPVVAVAEPDAVIALAVGMTSWAGVLFTLVLAAAAGPVLVGLTQQAKLCAVAEDLANPDSVTAWLREEGFGFGKWRHALEAVAVVGPSLVGAAGPPAVEMLRRIVTGE